MKIKKNDKVKIISGGDKGKTGKVISVFPKTLKIIVEGVNIKKKHKRAGKSNQKGQIIERSMPIFASKAVLVKE